MHPTPTRSARASVTRGRHRRRRNTRRLDCVDSHVTSGMRGPHAPEPEGVALRDIIIIGSGPAGFTAAIYAARAELKPLLIASSVEIGGELMNTTEGGNYPGSPDAS